MTSRKTAARVPDRWKIYRDKDNNWRWKYIMQGKTVAQAHAGFEEYSDCVADARSRGYRDVPAKA